MFTADVIEELFTKRSREGRFVFTPKWNSPVNSHQYALTFLPPERRFVLSRMKIEPFVTVDDEELVAAFRNILSDDDMASCMRLALNPPEEEDIPF